MHADALFVMIGSIPRSDYLGDEIRRDRWGFVLAGPDLREGTGRRTGSGRSPLMFETSLPGVFAIGDVRHGSVKRVASAVGAGAMVVAMVHEYLAGRAAPDAAKGDDPLEPPLDADQDA